MIRCLQKGRAASEKVLMYWKQTSGGRYGATPRNFALKIMPYRKQANQEKTANSLKTVGFRSFALFWQSIHNNISAVYKFEP